MTDSKRRRLVVAPSNRARIEAASDWVASYPADAELLVIAATPEAGDEFVRTTVGAARFGIARSTLNRLASRLAAPVLVNRGRTPAPGLSFTAVVASAVHTLSSQEKLSYFAPVAKRPGFPIAVARTLRELRMNSGNADSVRSLDRGGEDLALLADYVERELQEKGLADRAAIFSAAIEACQSAIEDAIVAEVRHDDPQARNFEVFEIRTVVEKLLDPATEISIDKVREMGIDDAEVGDQLEFPKPRKDLMRIAAQLVGPPAGLPLLLLDPSVSTEREALFVSALAELSPSVFCVVPAGDLRTLKKLESALKTDSEKLNRETVSNSLTAIRAHIFDNTEPPEAKLDESVELKSWPGEAREAVEIARAIRREAATGVPFDKMAVLLRSPFEQRPGIEEAFRRAEVPIYFARGSSRPDPAGRALLALLACASEHLSARRFAEYLSLGQVPHINTGFPLFDRPEVWQPPQTDVIPETALAEDEPEAGELPKLLDDPDEAVSVDGTLQAPSRWEKILVEAAVIGGADRWERRLGGLKEELELRLEELQDEDEARALYVERQLRDLTHLRDFAIPIIKLLSELPKEADWREWIDHLRTLATVSLRTPERVMEILSELEPMSEVGPVDLDDVQLVLGPRLRELIRNPPRRRYGRVFVGSTDSARGIQFEVVFVPGLAEKLFPRKIIEDPILLDRQRVVLRGLDLVGQDDRIELERLALRLAVGAANKKLYLSYPRVDVQQARPRVPSFYSLEVLRAAEGKLPGFHELASRAESGAPARLGWPAPAEPSEAIDEAEYDLSLLAGRLQEDPDVVAGTATYLLSSNPHLARALRTRARRWIKRWTTADGLVDPDEIAMAAMEPHQMSRRSFSPTALQNFADCPYRFFLQAILRLEPREDPSPLEMIDPLTRGSLFHHVQYELLTQLRKKKLLPLNERNINQAITIADEVLDHESRDYEDELAPAIPKVWEDGINAIRADLREWLRRSVDRDEGWVPHHFELSFGLADRDREDEDPASVEEPVEILEKLKLRGSIDLVERQSDGRLRATDHKTGKARADKHVVIGGGKHLQPVLYALACEELLQGKVDAGRLYYCTFDGGYEERVVPLNDFSRGSAGIMVGILDRALQSGFLPAAPDKDACRWCNYRPVCGPREELRVKIKPRDRLMELKELRERP